MDNEILKVDAAEAGMRLDVYLARRLRDRYSRSRVKRFIENSLVTVSSKTRKAHYRVIEGDVVNILTPEAGKTEIAPEKIPLEVIYEDGDIIVINKPPGMVVHPAPGNTGHTLVNALLFHTKNRLANINGTRPGIVHRLDKEVSGLVVAAKTDSAYRALVESFKARFVKKTYIAFVRGVVSRDEAFLELPIGRAARDRKKMAVRFFNSKEALTRFKVLKRFKDYTKLSIRIDTGRTHQIRVHMSYIGHPVIGDTKYGGGAFKRIALYAAELELSHPRTGSKALFKIGIPEDLKTLDR